MRTENSDTTGLDKDDNGGDTYPCPQSLRPIPPPEAFRHLNASLHFTQHNDECQDESEQPNRKETILSSTNTTGASAGQRPSLLIRRQSSLFGQLPVRRKSRLFEDIAISNSDANKSNKNSVCNNIAAETIMTSATNFSRSQSTWLQEDHQSTLLGGSRIDFSNGIKSQSQSRNPKSEEQRQEVKSSLFGAVMKKFSSSISGALPATPSSPFGNEVKDTSPQKNRGGGFRDLIASPSGQTIMNIVNQFNSPFKFQSPSSSHKKRHRRRRLWDDDRYNSDSNYSVNAEDTEKDSYATPTKRMRIQIEEEDEDSKPSSNNLFPDNDNNDSRSSLGGGLVDENWREAPIIDADEKNGVRMEVLDWSLATKVRIEVHGSAPRQQSARSISDTWVRDVICDNEDVLMYWIYESPIIFDRSTSISQNSGPIVQNSSNSNLVVQQKSIGTTKAPISRQSSFSSRFDTKLQNSQSMSRQGSFSNRHDLKLQNGRSRIGNNNIDRSESSSSVNRLAKHLIQSVRGPNAKYSRKRVLEYGSWWDEEMATSLTVSLEDNRERFQQQWQQALRSLFSNYRQRILNTKNPKDSSNSMVLGTYFYCIGHDHAVLFRIAAGGDKDMDDNVDGNNGKTVPIVLVSSTSLAFRRQLELNGMDLECGSDGDESIQLLESIQERGARERKRIAAATAASIRRNKRVVNDVLLSPGVRADLEALRRAQAFGESAGADVFVKVKKTSSQYDDLGKENLPKGIRITGWDNVSLFLEVYSNLLGDAMGSDKELASDDSASIAQISFDSSKFSNKRLPMLVCPNGKGFGPFNHASLKRLRFFPVETMPNADSLSETNKPTEGQRANEGNAIEIHGILLPCVLRKLLLVTRNRILEDEKTTSGDNSSSTWRSSKRIAFEEHPRNADPDNSKYIVVHSTRPTTAINYKGVRKSWFGGLNGSLIFNQGKMKTTEFRNTGEKNVEVNANKANEVFECSYGEVISMAVWDTSREEVAACKLDNAFPEI